MHTFPIRDLGLVRPTLYQPRAELLAACLPRAPAPYVLHALSAAAWLAMEALQHTSHQPLALILEGAPREKPQFKFGTAAFPAALRPCQRAAQKAERKAPGRMHGRPPRDPGHPARPPGAPVEPASAVSFARFVRRQTGMPVPASVVRGLMWLVGVPTESSTEWVRRYEAIRFVPNTHIIAGRLDHLLTCA